MARVQNFAYFFRGHRVRILSIFTLALFLGGLFLLLSQHAWADTETLRPNGAGSETAITTQFPASTFHYDKVDEETTDDNTTYVNAGGSNGWYRDLYALPTHTGSGVINSVTVYARLKDGVGSVSSGKISIRTNDTTYDTNAYALTTSWADKSNTWTTNPQTGSAWTWDEIDALEAGISLAYAPPASPSILKGQPILMADGSQKNIEDIRVGDEIISFNLDAGKAEKDMIVGLWGGPHDDYLVFNGTLQTSLNHIIWSDGKWKSAEDIKVGEFLLNSRGQEIEVAQIKYVRDKVNTYDLEVEKNHNFFVSNYLVHNVTTGYATQLYVVVDYTLAAAGGALRYVPALVVALSADIASLTPGQSSTHTWSIENASCCWTSWGWSGTTFGTSSKIVTPTSTPYTLACFNDGGSDIRTVMIEADKTIPVATTTPTASTSTSSTLPLSEIKVPLNFNLPNPLQLGMRLDDIRYLQIILNADTDTRLAELGPGSPSNETDYFGPLTQGAVIKFQEKYVEDILSPWQLTKGTGFVGKTTQAKLNKILGR